MFVVGELFVECLVDVLYGVVVYLFVDGGRVECFIDILDDDEFVDFDLFCVFVDGDFCELGVEVW